MDWKELQNEINKIFLKFSKKLDLYPSLDLHFIEESPIVDEFVFGEAFPDKNKIWLEVVAPEASSEEILKIISHEFVHLKHPDWNHFSKRFEELEKEWINI